MTNVIILLIIPSNCKLMLFAWKKLPNTKVFIAAKKWMVEVWGLMTPFLVEKGTCSAYPFPSPLEILPENAFWSYLSGFLVTVTESKILRFLV